MAVKQETSKLFLFPITAEVNGKGHLVIGGCDSLELAHEYGTPLYVFDEFGLRSKCAEFKEGFGKRYPDTLVIYASKAFTNKAIALMLKEGGLGLDVVSAGEMSIAHSVDFPMDKVFFHGNNKSADELKLALEWGVGHIVVDNFHELAMLDKIAAEQRCMPDILLRLTPGIDPHTHEYNTTGNTDSKFGFTLSIWDEAVTSAMSKPNLNLVGLDFHLGSIVFESEPYQKAIELILDFARAMKQKHGFELRELDIGGGFAVQYTLDRPAPPISDYAEVITSLVKDKCRELKLSMPRLIVEPGRAIVAQPCVALYTVGVVKDIPDIRCYVSVDGGMADNIRHALYRARHEAIVANKALEKAGRAVTVAGKFCESGDILIRDIDLPPLSAGDILAVADCGAYCLPMASNYNAALKPAVVLVRDGKARLIRRRETFDDLTRCDLV
jgi:diaminopimelate decarboxylase